MSINFWRRYGLVVPGYHDLFGHGLDIREIVGIIRQVRVQDWLSFLNRIQLVLGSHHIHNVDRQAEILTGVLSPYDQEAVQDFVSARHADGVRSMLFQGREIGTLQQLSILYAPETGPRRFDTPIDRGPFGSAIFATQDAISPPPSEDADDILAAIAQHAIRTSATPYWRLIARAASLYELFDIKSSETAQYLDLFTKATASDGDETIIGGLIILLHEEQQTRQDRAMRWRKAPSYRDAKDPVLRRVLHSYESTRTATIPRLRKEVRRREAGLHIRDWNLIAISRFPIVSIPRLGPFILNHTAVAQSLFGGIRHDILTAALEKRLPGYNQKTVGGLYGKLLERYVGELLEEKHGSRVKKIPEAQHPGLADYVVVFPDRIIVLEVKGEHFRAVDHFCLLTLDERRREIERTGIKKSAQQVKATIEALVNGKLAAFVGKPDWTTTTIAPCIVTEEEFPLFPMCWERVYASAISEIESLPKGRCSVGSLRMLNLTDLETAIDIDSSEDFATILLKWGRDPELADYGLRNFLHGRGYTLRDDFVRSRIASVSDGIAAQLRLGSLSIP